VAFNRYPPVRSGKSWRRVTVLRIRLLCHFQRVINSNAEISNGAFKIRVPTQQLNRAEILRPAVDERRFSPSQRMILLNE
jgi:hypothetical protein